MIGLIIILGFIGLFAARVIGECLGLIRPFEDVLAERETLKKKRA
ncbi:hypothetical protein [Salmonella phage vB_SenM_SB18]|uniref:Uncharacterized protein n=4 Tax=Caudoviricetes TaxID=2731619 RepID=A0A6B9RK75_9CAUD|nr:hypothetical protein SUNLIREN_22 [Erwinia phage SunLIRen]QEG07676.1 hypothetical protein [Salmonella phage SE5]QHI00568.1 hypothetical protein [Salmonella phage vB_SenM_SB18]UFD98333.1 hypothetical protein SPARTY_10 [Hafnia phage vB_HalM_SPARTY]